MRDVVGGALLILFGLAFALFAISRYPLGTIARMEPGMFPAIVGFLLAAIGAVIVVPAIFRQRVHEAERSAAPLTVLSVLGGIVGFGVVITMFGMVPAVYFLVVVATLPDRRLSWLGKVALASAIAVLVVAIFRFGLSLNVALVKWPL
jgi:hypothetical protein